jgi:hypothetical protein
VLNVWRLLLLLARLSLNLTPEEIVKLEAALTPTIHTGQEQVTHPTNSYKEQLVRQQPEISISLFCFVLSKGPLIHILKPFQSINCLFVVIFELELGPHSL